MKARSILFILTLLCCLTAGIGVAANYFHLVNFTEKDAHRNAENLVAIMAQELDAEMIGRASQVAVQSAMPDVRRYLSVSQSDISMLSFPILDREMTELLNSICQLNGASLCYLLNTRGEFIASNDFDKKPSTLGTNFSFRPYFQQAVSGGSSIYPAKGASTNRRGLYFSHRIDDENGRFIGVVVNKFPLQPLEARFRQVPGKMLLMDSDGIVFASNYEPWLFTSLLPLSSLQQNMILNTAQFGSAELEVQQLRWIGGNHLEDTEGAHYDLYRHAVEHLPGWYVAYLRDVEHAIGMGSSDVEIMLILAVLSIAVVLLVTLLYRHGRDQIRRRQEAETSLQQSQARLLQLAQVSTEAILMHQGDKIIDFNEVSERMFGYPRDELKNVTLFDLFGEEGKAEVLENYVNCSNSFEAVALRRDGTSFPIEVFPRNSVVDGELIGMSCIRDITRRKENEERVAYQAQFDALTNLPNRKLMHNQLIDAIYRAKTTNTLAVLMFIDLDDFKKINDTLGHDVGDELLISVANRLQDTISDLHTLARYGGDEFILLIENQQDLTYVERLAERILSRLGMEFFVQGRSFYISGSIGIAVAPTDGEQPEELLKKADTAMYRVKDEGRNGFSFYSPDMNTDIANRLELEHQLRGALKRGELSLNYQPIFCLKDHKMTGAEVLVRWNNESLGMVGPDQFIPVAEQTGLILTIGKWIAREACLQAMIWREIWDDQFSLALNVSPRQFRDGHIVPMLSQVLEETGFPAESLVIEITEGLLFRNDEATAQSLRQLRAMGIQLSMDDFGTGYSSLSYLKQFPFDILKIDRSFVRDIETEPGDQQLIVATLAMAKGLGLEVVAEGIENQNQLDFLIESGCDAAQGYLLGKPMSAAEFQQQLEKPPLRSVK